MIEVRLNAITRSIREAYLPKYQQAGWAPVVSTEVINLRPAKTVIQAVEIEDDNAIIQENINGNIDGQ